MSEIASAFVRIRPNMAGFQQETESGVKKAFTRVAEYAGAYYAGKSIFDFGKDVVQQASQIQKSSQAIQQSFGQASQSVLKFGEDSSHALGISTSQSEAASAKFGILFQNLGIGHDQAAKMTVGLQQLAGSLSAIRGVDPTQALNGLSTAMLGNLRSLKQLGLSFSNAQIQQEALRLGLLKTAAASGGSVIADEKVAIAKANLANAEKKYGDGTTQVASAQIALQKAQAAANSQTTKAVGTLTPAAKAQAIYALATKNLGQDMTQAAAHSGDLANVQRRLSADWQSAEETIGTALLPTITKLVDGFDAWLERLQKTGVLQHDVQVGVRELTELFTGVSAAVHVVWSGFKDLTDVLGGSKEAIIAFFAVLAVSKIKAIAETITTTLVQNGLKTIGVTAAAESEEYVAAFGTMELATMGLAATIKSALISTGIGAIAVAIGIAAAEVITHWNTVKAWLDDFAGWMENHWKPIVFGVFGPLGLVAGEIIEHWKPIKNWFVDFAHDFAELFTHPIAAVEKMFDDLETAIIGVLKNIVGQVGDLLASIPTKILGIHIPGASELHDWGKALQSWGNGGTEIGNTMANNIAGAIQSSSAITDAVANAAASALQATSNDSSINALIKGGKTPGSVQSVGTLSVNAGVDLKDENSMIPLALKALSQAGYQVVATSGYRTYAQQAALYARYVKSGFNIKDIAAKPGTSNHETGNAVDAYVNGKPVSEVPAALAILKKYGLFADVPGDLEHLDLKGYGSTGTTAGTTGGTSGAGNLVVGTLSKVNVLKQQIASAKSSMQQTFADLKNAVSQGGGGLDDEVKKRMKAVAADITNISSKADITKARSELKDLHNTVTAELSAIAKDKSLTKVYDSLKQATAELGTTVSPKVKSEMQKIQNELKTISSPADAAAVKKQIADLSDVITAQLKVTKERVTLTNLFGPVKTSAAELHDDITPGIEATMKQIQAAIGSVTTPAQESKVKQQITSLKTLIAQQLKAVEDQIKSTKSSFESAYQSLASGIDTAFQNATQKALAAIQVTVAGSGFSDFLFGGGVAQTPSEILLQNLQDAKTAADQAAQLLADQKQKASDVAGGTATSDQIAADQVAIDNDLYDQKVTALTKQATLERNAANTQLQAAQTAYQQQRDLLQQQLDYRVSQIETGMENGNISVSDGLKQMTALLNDPQYGIDAQSAGIVIAGSLYDGLSTGLQPVFDLIQSLLDHLAKAGLKYDSDGNLVSDPGAASKSGLSSISPGATVAQAASQAGSFAQFSSWAQANHVPGFATGGIVPGIPAGPLDTVRARVSTGEGIIDRDGMKRLLDRATSNDDMDAAILAELRRQTELAESHLYVASRNTTPRPGYDIASQVRR